MLSTILDIGGFATVTAGNGLEGLRALKEHHPCLILLDLSMPVMDGWHFREEQLRLSDPELAETPVVVLSALTECREYASELGAADSIPKPVDFERLLEAVRQHCRV